jgi:hypothetical protein
MQVFDAFAIARGGYALNDAAKQLKEVIQAVEETGKVGEITLTLKIKPDKNDSRIVELIPDVKTKIPRRSYASGHAFIGKGHTLSKEDPAQLELLEERRAAGVASIGASEAALSQVGRGTS